MVPLEKRNQSGNPFFEIFGGDDDDNDDDGSFFPFSLGPFDFHRWINSFEGKLN